MSGQRRLTERMLADAESALSTARAEQVIRRQMLSETIKTAYREQVEIDLAEERIARIDRERIALVSTLGAAPMNLRTRANECACGRALAPGVATCGRPQCENPPRHIPEPRHIPT